MTILTDRIADLAGHLDGEPVIFVPAKLRENSAGTGIVSSIAVTVKPVSGVLETPDLEPGPAIVRVCGQSFRIDIPVTTGGAKARLWPLIQAGSYVPPDQEAAAVRNAGGVAMIRRVTETEYSRITNPDPATLYVIRPDGS